MTEELRIVAAGRVLLPGAVYTFPLPDVPRLGARLFVRFAASPVGSAGTIGVVEELRRLPEAGSVVTVFGAERAVPTGPPAPGTVVVEPVEEVDGRAREALTDAVGALRSYLGALAEFGEEANVMAEVPDEPVAGSYRLALLARISEPERQELLDISSTARRLETIAEMFRRERRLLTAAMGKTGKKGR